MPKPRAIERKALKYHANSNQYISVEKRKITWYFLIAFLLGAVFAVMTADPISDLLFFWRSSLGTELSPVEQVFYWYYLPGMVDAAILLGAVLIARVNNAKPEVYAIIIAIFGGVSLVFSLGILGISPIVIILLTIPFLVLVFILFFKTSIGKGCSRVEL